MSSIWDLCAVDDTQLAEILKYEQEILQMGKNSQTNSVNDINTSTNLDSALECSDSGIDGLQAVLLNTESSCHNFMNELDHTLEMLCKVASSHSDVTGRTNSLMLNCENLLEQQVQIFLKRPHYLPSINFYIPQATLQSTVEVLRDMLVPFNDIEEVAGLLGIPVDPRGHSTAKAGDLATVSIDPRSAEFQNILARLSKAFGALRAHKDLKESEKYQKWLEQLQNRATSLVARAMRELLESASRACGDLNMKTGGIRKVKSLHDQPLESAPIYQKFRGLGFRMRELSALLKSDPNAIPSYPKDTQRAFSYTSRPPQPPPRTEQDVIAEVKQGYVFIRNELLLPFVKEVGLAGLAKQGTGTGISSGSTGGASTQQQQSGGMQLQLCPGIRNAYSILLRIAQLEQQLFDSLFKSTDKVG